MVGGGKEILGWGNSVNKGLWVGVDGFVYGVEVFGGIRVLGGWWEFVLIVRDVFRVLGV